MRWFQSDTGSFQTWTSVNTELWRWGDTQACLRQLLCGRTDVHMLLIQVCGYIAVFSFYAFFLKQPMFSIAFFRTVLWAKFLSQNLCLCSLGIASTLRSRGWNILKAHRIRFRATWSDRAKKETWHRMSTFFCNLGELHEPDGHCCLTLCSYHNS